jgi:serine/threonine protein kinase
LHVFFSETLENILVTHPDDLSNLKITDFGLSTQLDSQFPRSVTLQCGTLIYMAPEILFRYTYTKSVDIYSCSIIMYMLFHQGRHPIYTSKMTAEEYKKLLLHVKFPPLQGQETAIDGLRLAQNLMDRVSKYEALERYNVVETLKHPWITRRFNDQIPLSIYESFMSFENTQRVLLLIRLSFILSCQQL